ncbi:phosphatase PAP2 family protein [Hydrocarboniphaga sp.]|uniref:phosphatase PAP2 family protein n=1 Tax=Hydrocarboniphaga sp. TaxID=2033016 RepID=UPI0026214B9E|nr:phosphatase PAP2 family protein [Hydrocarboniphaga sp.]
MPSLRSLLIDSAALFGVVLLCALWLDRPLAMFLHEHAAALVAPARGFTDTMTRIVQPALPKWAHPLAIAIIGALLAWRGGLAWARPFWLTAAVLLATRFSVTWLKGVFERVRPHDYVAQPTLNDFFVAGHESFPSGHTAVYMGLLLPPALLLPRWRWPLLALAAICALARVAEGDHYLGDVAASTLIALLFTILLGRVLGVSFAEPRA